jgi:hypothetical protein
MQRCYVNYYTEMDQFVSPQMLAVDLYAESIGKIPTDATAGMTVLIDKGAHSLETGIYIIRYESLPPIKVNVPEVGQLFYISKGPFAGCTHKIKPSFLELQPPSETQVMETDVVTLQTDTKKLVIPHHLSNMQIDISACTNRDPHPLTIQCFSSSTIRLITIAQDQIEIQGPFFGDIFWQQLEHKFIWFVPTYGEYQVHL